MATRVMASTTSRTSAGRRRSAEPLAEGAGARAGRVERLHPGQQLPGQHLRPGAQGAGPRAHAGSVGQQVDATAVPEPARGAPLGARPLEPDAEVEQDRAGRACVVEGVRALVEPEAATVVLAGPTTHRAWASSSTTRRPHGLRWSPPPGRPCRHRSRPGRRGRPGGRRCCVRTSMSSCSPPRGLRGDLRGVDDRPRPFVTWLLRPRWPRPGCCAGGLECRRWHHC